MSLVITRCIEFPGGSNLLPGSGEITCNRGSEDYFSLQLRLDGPPNNNLIRAHVEIHFDDGSVITSRKDSVADWLNAESQEIFSWGNAKSFYLVNTYTPATPRLVTWWEGYVYFYEVAY